MQRNNSPQNSQVNEGELEQSAPRCSKLTAVLAHMHLRLYRDLKSQNLPRYLAGGGVVDIMGHY